MPVFSIPLDEFGNLRKKVKRESKVCTNFISRTLAQTERKSHKAFTATRGVSRNPSWDPYSSTYMSTTLVSCLSVNICALNNWHFFSFIRYVWCLVASGLKSIWPLSVPLLSYRPYYTILLTDALVSAFIHGRKHDILTRYWGFRLEGYPCRSCNDFIVIFADQ